MKKLLLFFIGVLFMTGSSWGQVTNFPYTENFDGPWLGSPRAPAGWIQIKIAGSANIQWEKNYYASHSDAAVSFPAEFAGEFLLVTPGLDFDQKSYRLKFVLRGDKEYGPASRHNNLKVQIAGSNASAGNFTNTLAHYETGVNMPGQWEEIIIDLSPYKGVQYIAFRMISYHSDTKFAIDDVIIEEIASATSIWTGAISNDWANAGNWNGSSIPGSITNVTIPVDVPNYPTISSEAYCNTITLKSDAGGTASLLGNEMLTITTGSANVERYLTGGWGEWNEGWHHISSPVAAQAIVDFETTGENNGYDFYGWEETTDTWMNQKDADFATWNGGTNFNIGQGYLVSYESALSTKTFTGVLNKTDVTANDLTQTGTIYNGWNLLGNPFASALTWNDGNWILGNVAGGAKIWHEDNKSYSDIPERGIIPMAQGFMVQVNDATSLTIPAASRVHNSQAFYKSATEQLLLVATETEGGSAQESKIRVNSKATEGFDFEYDSRFLAGYAPEFYSVVGDEFLSTNSLPSIDAGLVIPFGFVKNAASAFTISLKESLPGRVVYLTDNQTGKMTNLSENPVYSFTSNEGDDASRFLVTFGSLGINNPEAAEAINVYAYGNVLYLETPSKEAALVNVYNLTGQLVMQAKTGGNSLNTLNASELSNGIYVVNVMLNNAVVSRKVSIRK